MPARLPVRRHERVPDGRTAGKLAAVLDREPRGPAAILAMLGARFTASAADDKTLKAFCRRRASAAGCSPGFNPPAAARAASGGTVGAMSVRIFGDHDEATVTQLENCVAAEEGAEGVLCADGHLGYSMPIGGVVAYRDHISPSGVGFDIACGNKAARTDLTLDDVEEDLPRIMDEVFRRVSFGVGRNDGRAGDHGVIEE